MRGDPCSGLATAPSSGKWTGVTCSATPALDGDFLPNQVDVTSIRFVVWGVYCCSCLDALHTLRDTNSRRLLRSPAFYNLSKYSLQPPSISINAAISHPSSPSPLFIPTEIGGLTGLVSQFAFEGNDVGSVLPTEIGKLTGLKTGAFSLVGNEFTGPLPTELGMLTAMSHSFTIQDNSFESAVSTTCDIFMKYK